MKSSRSQATPPPARPLEERHGKSPVMGRGDIAKKLAKFKGNKPKQSLRPAHVPQPIAKHGTAKTQPSQPVAKTQHKPVSSSKSTPTSSAKAKPIAGNRSESVSGQKSRSGSQRNSVARSRGRNVSPVFGIQKTVRRWLDDTKLALESPDAHTLERLGARGSWRDALGYVGLSAGLTALLAFRTGWRGVIAVWLLTMISYAVFVWVTHYAVTRQNGDGKLENVAYATALFWAVVAPFTALIPFVLGSGWIPAAILAQIFAVRLACAERHGLAELQRTVERPHRWHRRLERRGAADGFHAVHAVAARLTMGWQNLSSHGDLPLRDDVFLIGDTFRAPIACAHTQRAAYHRSRKRAVTASAILTPNERYTES
jgi:hypothetical protein